ncbi:conserved hypothetical protein [uncultured Paludibacter sp.]|uniref:Fibronectin type-III domain-containing protein n=1 Tax=uncultured Paludibacter sp. TaxID=497635 RepID=A0A653AJY0_9BACT|nr:conserved hypothetical protein [uncultured Paludibacter sp.]
MILNIMKNIKFLVAIILIFGFGITQLCSQTVGANNNLTAQPIPDRTLYFNLSDSGVSKPITWGLDLAWLSETNIRRGIAYMGLDKIDIVRSSFTPTDSLIDGDLKTAELNTLNARLKIMDLLDSHTVVMLNDDNPTVSSWYKGNAQHWAQLMDVTTRRVQEHGRKVISIAPFNEPDNTSAGQGTITDFYNICGELRNNPRFDSIRISGGNTLNTDYALAWYNPLKSRLNEGNTHQLAGSFDNYVNFFETVRTNGHYATNDELHNVMEAMVGVEYGMQNGIWWGTAELARGEFVKASYGKRLGYAEHRSNWTAASVYRNPEGKIQAFGGTSERQAATTTYRFVSKDRDVFYDGYGPQREYTMILPGGTGYQQGQTNAEKVVNITWGDDIQPVINGKYTIINRNSGKAIEVAFGYTTNGTNIFQRTYSGKTYQQWNVTPVDSRVGGDFSYFTLTAVHSGKTADVNNFSLDNGANVQQWDDNKSSNQQWYLEYAGDGWFYIRNRESAKCLEVVNGSLSDAANIQQWEKDGGTNQQWRFLPVDVTVEFVAPSAPTDLIATPNAESIQLNWTASPESDVTGYTIFRSETAGGPYNTIARDVKLTSFVDNTATTSEQRFYVVKAIDKSMNRSAYSNEVSSSSTGINDIIVHYEFENATSDSTVNLNHGASYGGISYVDGKNSSKAISLNGTDAFVQMPSDIANQQEITIATWVYWKGAAGWQRIFDFGNDQSQYMFLTPNTGAGQMRFAIKNGGNEQQLNTNALTIGKWTHIAVTLNGAGAKLYMDGELITESSNITINPLNFKPILNYIGRSQFSDPLFKGYIDDFRIYNYALSAEEIKQISGIYNSVNDIDSENNLTLWPVPADKILNLIYSSNYENQKKQISIYNTEGALMLNKEINSGDNIKIDTSNFSSGVYIIKLTGSTNAIVKKIIVNH